MTVTALEQGFPIDLASCYFEVWMLRLAGVFPDLFACSACSAFLDFGAERLMTAGMQGVVCVDCGKGTGNIVLREVVELVAWVLRNGLKPLRFRPQMTKLYETCTN
jgi:recombinational DNA repair protein (RecF pathway)